MNEEKSRFNNGTYKFSLKVVQKVDLLNSHFRYEIVCT